MWPSTRRQLVIAVFVMVAARFPVNAQPNRDYWLSNEGIEIQAAMHVFGPGDPMAAILVRMLASEDGFLKTRDTSVGGITWRFDFDEPLPLPERLLKQISDRRPIPKVQREELKGADKAWYDAYNQALKNANRADMDLDKFKKGAEPNQRLLYIHLRDQPEVHRGKIVSVNGELIAVREEAPPRFVGPDLTNIYVGYITNPTKGIAPYIAVFTELPDAIRDIPRRNWEKLGLDVSFDGYFLSLVRFPAEKGKVSKNDQISPYLIGRSLIVHGKAKVEPPPPEEEGSYSYPIILAIVSGIVGVLILGAILNVWLRRGDRQTHARLAEVRDRHNPFDVEPAEPAPSTPVTPVDTGIQPADHDHDPK